MVQHKAIADLAGVFLDDIDCLLRGEVTARIAARVGVNMMDIEDFIRGSASAALAKHLSLTMSAAEELARLGGKDGAIGIILGLMIS
jgi:hypothetical protein